jgi:hypothetical protein
MPLPPERGSINRRHKRRTKQVPVVDASLRLLQIYGKSAHSEAFDKNVGCVLLCTRHYILYIEFVIDVEMSLKLGVFTGVEGTRHP